ncbi:hypothetical protein [Streptomyces sp. NPDC051662]|uniref:hypothetical protein n=1 Tax=Streptomyces sp. NPDC051662 TaxID=3154750 RepID=UPI00341314D1
MITMPTARDVFPAGTPKSVCEDFNRHRKSVPTAMELFRQHGGRLAEADILGLSDKQMADAALSAGVKVPGGNETRNLIRAELRNLAGLPPRPDSLAPATAPAPTPVNAIARPAGTLTPEQLDALLGLGLPVILVPARAA